MLLATELTGHRAVLFPEAVALAYGVWSLRRAAWARPVPLVAVPTACAVLGLACAWAPGPRWVWTAVALAGAVGLLALTRSPLIPAVSAAVLPVVFGIRDLEYPLAVLVWCGIPALTVLRVRAAPFPGWPAGRLATFVVAAAAWIAGAGLAGLPALVVAPPLLVAGLEFVARGGRVRSWSALRRGVLMTVAGMLGALALASPVPAPLAGALGVAVLLGLAALLREPLTPAAALVLVPFVAGVPDPLLVGGSFAAGALMLTVLPAALLAAVGAGRRLLGRGA